MKVLMISTDRKMREPSSSVALRMQSYAELFDELTIVLAGTGVSEKFMVGKARVLYPGGRSRAQNFFNIVRALRNEHTDITTVQDPVWTALAAVWAKKTPLQIQLHTDHLGTLGTLIARYTLRFATCVRVVSERARQLVAKMTRAPISVLPIYVDRKKFEVSHPRPTIFGSHPVVITVSRLSVEKRLDLVLHALVDVPEAHLYVLGDGPERQRLESVIHANGLRGRVHFVGWVDDVAPYYQHADCFVQASAFEGYGMALVDAVLAGCPAVSIAVGVATELPQGAVTIAPGTKYGLARAISTTLHSERARAEARVAREALLQSLPTEAEYLETFKKQLTSCGS